MELILYNLNKCYKGRYLSTITTKAFLFYFHDKSALQKTLTY